VSITKVLPYFRDCLCSIGLEEWTAEVTSDEPPNTTVDRNFRNILAEAVNHTSFEYRVPVTVILYAKTFRSQIEGVDCLIEKVEEANCCLLDLVKRYQAEQNNIKAVVPTSVSFEPISVTNDNVLKAVMDFEVVLHVEYRN